MRNNLTILLLLLSVLTWGQKTAAFLDDENQFKIAKDLLLQQKYGAARQAFEMVRDHSSQEKSAIVEEAEYWIAFCSLELFNKDGEALMRNFLKQHPNGPFFAKGNLYLGNYFFRKKKYIESVAAYNFCQPNDLQPTQRAEFYFKRGYSEFESWQHQGGDKLLEQALHDFQELKTLIPNNYLSSGIYYSAHIQYVRKKYESALKGFLTLLKDESFGPIVPYYITQIYYLQGNYDEAVKFAGPLLKDTVNINRAPEIARIIGESYYRKGQYNDALPYLQLYEKGIGKLGREDNYQMAYTYFRNENFESALHYFQLVAGADDKLTQNAYYHMGDCYIQLKNKSAARSAFGLASKTDFDSTITENSLFNYAKLCYDLGFNPYSEAIKAFDHYLQRYPSSNKRDECFGYLANLYLTSGNYLQALQSLKRLQRMTAEYNAISQKVNFNFGLVHFNNNKFDSAIHYLNQALQFKEDQRLSALSNYWLGEAFYRTGDYLTASENYQNFSESNAFGNLIESKQVYYNLGYCYLQLKEYPKANINFRKFISEKLPLKDVVIAKMVNDAYLRIGDTYFIDRDFKGACEFYGKAIENHAAEADYALFQKAQSLGLLGKYEEEIADLLKISSDFPRSVYNAEAKIDLGKAYLLVDQNKNALNAFSQVVESYPNSRFVNEALASMGLIYYNAKQDDDALSVFDKLIRRDRKSKEAESALATVKIIYLEDKKDVEGLDKYFQEIHAVLPSSALDSSAYAIADNAFKEGEWNEASIHFDKYLQRFPDGIFVIPANFQKAESDYKRADINAALVGYSFVATHDHKALREPALVKAIELKMKLGDYTGALQNCQVLDSTAEVLSNKLNANLNELRCLVQLNKYEEIVKVALRALSFESIAPENIIEVKYILANAQFALNDLDNAYLTFQYLTHEGKGAIRAEAYYRLAEINYKRKDYQASKSSVIDLVKKCPENPDWITRGMLLLSDDYLGLDDHFQAKHTLNTVIESSNLPTLVAEAKQKLEAINSSEQSPKNESSNPE